MSEGAAMNLTEESLWALINHLSWWYWGPIAALGAANVWTQARLGAPVTKFGRVLRVTGLMGFLLVALSPFNTAFGPLATPFLLVTFLGRHIQMYSQCKVKGRLPDKSDLRTPGKRLMASLVERPR